MREAGRRMKEHRRKAMQLDSSMEHGLPARYVKQHGGMSMSIK